MVCRTVAMLHYRPSVFQKHLIEATMVEGKAGQAGSRAKENERKVVLMRGNGSFSGIGTSVSCGPVECVGNHSPGTRKRG